MTKQHLFLFQCKQGMEEEYKKRHKAVYPEVLAALKKVGVSNYSIFMQGTQLYAYMETDDYEGAMKQLAQDPANQKWQQYMKEIMETNDQGIIIEVIKEHVFYLE
ncbi:MAG: L-rhamnose mutarotase [Desulfitobacteriaceae bacterium]